MALLTQREQDISEGLWRLSALHTWLKGSKEIALIFSMCFFFGTCPFAGFVLSCWTRFEVLFKCCAFNWLHRQAPWATQSVLLAVCELCCHCSFSFGTQVSAHSVQNSQVQVTDVIMVSGRKTSSGSRGCTCSFGLPTKHIHFFV